MIGKHYDQINGKENFRVKEKLIALKAVINGYPRKIKTKRNI